MCEEKESIKVKQINEEREEVEEKPTMKQTTIKDTFQLIKHVQHYLAFFSFLFFSFFCRYQTRSCGIICES